MARSRRATPSFDPTDIDRLQTEQKSYAVNILGQDGIEGFETSFYVPGGGQHGKSGATIGNGVDLGQQSPEGLAKMGVHPHVLDKLKSYGVYGLQGQSAQKRIEFIETQPGYNRLTPGEINHLSNKVTDHTTNSIVNKIGEDAWNAKPEGVQTAAISLRHIYGSNWYNHVSYKQFENDDYAGLKANMENYGDKTPGMADGVNNRHRRVSIYIPDPNMVVAVNETREQEMNRLSTEMRESGETQRMMDDQDIPMDSTYTEDIAPKAIPQDDNWMKKFRERKIRLKG